MLLNRWLVEDVEFADIAKIPEIVKIGQDATYDKNADCGEIVEIIDSAGNTEIARIAAIAENSEVTDFAELVKNAENTE